jgi:hypothetical protein
VLLQLTGKVPREVAEPVAADERAASAV